MLPASPALPLPWDAAPGLTIQTLSLPSMSSWGSCSARRCSRFWHCFRCCLVSTSSAPSLRGKGASASALLDQSPIPPSYSALTVPHGSIPAGSGPSRCMSCRGTGSSCQCPGAAEHSGAAYRPPGLPPPTQSTGGSLTMLWNAWGERCDSHASLGARASLWDG